MKRRRWARLSGRAFRRWSILLFIAATATIRRWAWADEYQGGRMKDGFGRADAGFCGAGYPVVWDVAADDGGAGHRQADDSVGHVREPVAMGRSTPPPVGVGGLFLPPKSRVLATGSRDWSRVEPVAKVKRGQTGGYEAMQAERYMINCTQLERVTGMKESPFRPGVQPVAVQIKEST